MTPGQNHLATRLRSARITCGLTQADVARKLGVRRPAISEIEAGRRAVSSDELYRLSRLFETPVARLLGEAPTATEANIAHMARVIVQRFDPERIILFGSHGRGTSGPDSDVDLLIVLRVRGSKRQKAVEIGAALHDIRVPKDILVTTPEEFAWRQHVVGTIERTAAREGSVLYERR